jgi:hypothetical protein
LEFFEIIRFLIVSSDEIIGMRIGRGSSASEEVIDNSLVRQGGELDDEGRAGFDSLSSSLSKFESTESREARSVVRP